ncbi:MAG: SIS domain-containing protein [Dehalococcoidia bacterium]
MNWNEKISDLQGLLNGMEATDASGALLSHEEAFARWYALACELQTNRRMLYFVGNGASASMACHFSADIGKNARIHTQVFTDPSLVTAMANDISYQEAFATPLRLWGQEGDLLIAISSSGKSPNILAAVAAAKEVGITSVTLSAMGPDNPLRRAGDLNFYVAARTYGNAETCHATILHHWVDALMGEVAVLAGPAGK